MRSITVQLLKETVHIYIGDSDKRNYEYLEIDEPEARVLLELLITKLKSPDESV